MSLAACKVIIDNKQQAVGTLGLAACQLNGVLVAMQGAGLGTLEERSAVGDTIKSITAIECALAKTLPSTTRRFIELAMEGAVPAEGIDPPLDPDNDFTG